MKKVQLIISLVILFAISTYGQIDLKKIAKDAKKQAEKSIEKRIEKKINNAVDKTLDETEKALEGKSNKTEQTKNETSTDVKKETEAKKETSSDELKQNEASKPQLKTALVQWNKYDFVPGDIVIFEDDLEGEKNGEFPSKWDLNKGSIENALLDGENVILFIECNTNGGGGIIPLLKNSKEDYLPDEFTIEFDAYFERPNNSYVMYLADYKNQLKLDKDFNARDKWIRFEQNSSRLKESETNFYPGTSSKDTKANPGWRHIAVSFNKRALKTYLDDSRILNIPNLGYNPTGITLGYHNPSGNTKGYIKTVRIAKGAVPLYDKMMTDGKIITNGIKFDIGKATIKPESMGIINEIVKLMNEKTELNFSVEGHTDSDNDDSSNQKLSEARAKAVMSLIIELGIKKERLKAKGFGETKPIADNNTPEGKANNRRVEFVKF